jgi:ribosomal protein S18 acetylase RimI-like enzyme
MYGDCTLVAELQGKVVGTLLGTHDHRKGWINRLAVDPAYQNQGVAQRMIAAAEAAFRSKKIDIYCALVETDNRPSRATFLKAGYVERSDVVYFRKELKL